MERYIRIFWVLWVLSLSVRAQGPANGGEALPFLGIAPDARSAAMGGAGVASETGAFSFWHNAAASVFSERRGAVAYSYAPWMGGLVSGSALNSVGGFYKIDDRQSVVAGFRDFSHPEMEMNDNNGNIIGRFAPRDRAMDVGYSRVLMKDLSVSLSVCYIHSDMSSYHGASAGSAVSFGLGVYYRRKTGLLDSAVWSAGVRIADIGTQIKYLGTEYALPGRLDAGGALHLPFSKNHVLDCALDLGCRLLPSNNTVFQAGIGAEYTCMKYAALLAGYHFGDKNRGRESYGSIGCGVRFRHFRGDFSCLLVPSGSPLEKTYRITIGIDFPQEGKTLRRVKNQI